MSGQDAPSEDWLAALRSGTRLQETAMTAFDVAALRRAFPALRLEHDG